MGMALGTVKMIRLRRRGTSGCSRSERCAGELMVTSACMMISLSRNIMVELRVKWASKATSGCCVRRILGRGDTPAFSKQASGVPSRLICWMNTPRVTGGSSSEPVPQALKRHCWARGDSSQR